MRRDTTTASVPMAEHDSIRSDGDAVRGIRTECRDRVSLDDLRAATAAPSAIQPLDGRRAVIMAPFEVRPGDWLRDLGTLRQVESVEDLPSRVGSGRIFVLRFASAPGVEDLTLSILGTVVVTIWRLM